MENYYYRETNWGVTVSLLDMWNGMTVYRHDANGTIVKTINVPITFGPVEKTQQTRTTDFPGDGDRYYLQLPRMALVPTGMVFNSDRAYSLNEDRFWLDEALELTGSDSVFSDYQPTPWDYNFTLHIRTDSMSDLSQIVENIVPYFTPKNMIRVKEFPFLNIERDLPVQLEGGVNYEFSDDLSTEEMRFVNASIDFRVEGWAYKEPTSAALVKVIQSRYFVGGGTSLDYNTSGDPISATVAASGTPTEWDAEYRTRGFDQTSAMPEDRESYDTSGYNSNSEVWWTHNQELSASPSPI